MISKWRYVWWPVALLYQIRSEIRDRLFELGIWKSVEFEVPIIYVGSLSNEPSIGISNYLKILTKGFLHVAKSQLRAYGLEKKETDLYCAAVSTDRMFCSHHKVLGLSEWYQRHPETPAFIMDDEFLKNEIRPQLRILLTSYKRLFFEDKLFPIGRLNHNKKAAKEADIVLIYETNSMDNFEERERTLRSYLKKDAAVFFIKNSKASLMSFNSDDKIEFIADRHNFERLILNLLPNANPESE